MLPCLIVAGVLISWFPREASAQSVAVTKPAHGYCKHGTGSFEPSTDLRAENPHSFDVLHYKMQILVEPTRRRIAGSTTVRASSRTSALASIDLNFRRMPITDVQMGGVTVGFGRTAGILTVNLDRPYEIGETFEVEIFYAGEPEDGFFFRSQTTYSKSQPDKARFWFPCHDEPSDKATSETLTTVPSDKVVVSNGSLLSVVDNGDGTSTYHWSESFPIATYLISLAISDYVEFGTDVDGVPLRFFVRPSELSNAQIDFEDTGDMMSFYTSIIFPYPFEKYAMATAPFSGAMEHQTCTTLGSNFVTGTKTNQGIIAHELAHSWFGNLVTLIDTRDIWLNEGFATYFDALYTESRAGVEAFHDRIRNFHGLYINNEVIEGRFPIYDPRELFGATVYFKGASVLHMLRRVVGDENFFSTCREYASLFAFGNVSTLDFQAVAESFHGKSLDWFFASWIFERGYPALEYGFKSTPKSGGGFTFEFALQQIQENAPIFRFPLDVVVHTDAGDLPFVFEIDSRTERFMVDTPAPATGFTVDPDSWLLATHQDVGARAFRPGNVNARGGEVVDVLRVVSADGSSSGRLDDRVLEVRPLDPLELFVDAPPSRSRSRFAIYCVFEETGEADLVTLPGGIGTGVVPFPFTGGTPTVLFNNLGRFGLLGRPNLAALPAPVLAHRKPDGLRMDALTVQGLIQDDASMSDRGISLTNAIVLKLIPQVR